MGKDAFNLTETSRMPNFVRIALAALFLLLTPSIVQAQKSKDQTRGDLTFVTLDASSICSDCSIVQVSGTFGTETIKAYYDFVWRGRFKKNIYFVFDSLGGSMNAAMELGKILRNLKVNTFVGRAYVRNGEVEIEPGRCASACVFAFVGGATRSMPKESRLGVHSWMPVRLLDLGQSKEKKSKPLIVNQETVAELHRQTATYLRYLQTMGIDLRIAVTTLQTPYSSMTWLTSRDQSLWGLVTVDSRLSTPAGRRWPVLFLPSSEPAASAGQVNAKQRNS